MSPRMYNVRCRVTPRNRWDHNRHACTHTHTLLSWHLVGCVAALHTLQARFVYWSFIGVEAEFFTWFSLCVIFFNAKGERLVRPPSPEKRHQDGGRVIWRGGRIQSGHRAFGGDSGIGETRPGGLSFIEALPVSNSKLYFFYSICPLLLLYVLLPVPVRVRSRTVCILGFSCEVRHSILT